MDCITKLEFDIILEKAAAFAASDVVKRRMTSVTPVSDKESADKLLDQTGEAINVLASHRPDLSFDDISPLVNKAKVGAALSPAELLRIKELIGALVSLKNAVENTDCCDRLKDITCPVRVCDSLKSSIDRAVENETELKDSASEKLYSIRKAILRTNAKLKERLDGYTRQSDISKYLRDNIVTLRGGRYVLPVRSDSRAFVKGLVHDVSATGATVFIEPFAVVEANNELITLKTEEHNETERILKELSGEVAVCSFDLMTTQDVLTECGIIFARAEYAKKLDAFRPILNDAGRIVLLGARHPLIDSDKVVPVDIRLDKERVLLISGPNTGGKTVSLKIVGLFALMSACGMFIPAREKSEMSVFTEIFCDVGDAQSIEQSLSTFSAHVNNLAEITGSMNDKSLVLLDEVGDGTDPDEGAALAVAIIKRLLTAGATAVVTTHFNSVKEYALSCDGISSACMQFDNVNFKPTYVLLQGVAGSSYALEIAEKLGLDKEIIADARSLLSSEKLAFDRIMRETERLRNAAITERNNAAKLLRESEEKTAAAKRLELEYQAKLAELKAKERDAVRQRADEYSARADKIIEQMKEQLKNADEAALFIARKAAKQLSDGVPEIKIAPTSARKPASPDELTVGTRVLISGLNKEGVIASPPRGNKVLVAVGSVKTEVPAGSLSILDVEEKQSVKLREPTEKDPESRELMMLGLTVDEAVAELERVIDDIAPHSTIRIVHGKGTGALGKGIQAYLRKNRRIKSFRYGRYGEGDTGVTIAEIK